MQQDIVAQQFIDHDRQEDGREEEATDSNDARRRERVRLRRTMPLTEGKRDQKVAFQRLRREVPSVNTVETAVPDVELRQGGYAKFAREDRAH
ncbi:MAG: hypothetical protein ACR2H5_17235 [Ktedonobacteraceae bacterium]